MICAVLESNVAVSRDEALGLPLNDKTRLTLLKLLLRPNQLVRHVVQS